MIADLESFTPITKLSSAATQAEMISKINELVDHINALAPKVQGDELNAPLEPVDA